MSTEELAGLIERGGAVPVDARPTGAYNGWPLRGEPRAGHLPGARSLPRKWADYIDWPEIVESKGIGTASPMVVVYGYDRQEGEEVAAMLRGAGLGDVRTYSGFLDEWSPEPGLRLEGLPRRSALVPPGWLRSDAGDAAVVCHCHYRNHADYDAGHIPGAVALDTLALEAPETWNRREPDELRGALEALGISRATTVVLYGRDSVADPADPFPGSSAGQLAAMRCAFIMMYAGVEDVRVLDGGLRAWEDAGYAIERKPSRPRAPASLSAPVPGRPEIAVDLPEARRMLASGEGRLVDIRSRAEQEGLVSGYNYISRRGRIPGAVLAGSGSDAYHVEGFRNLDLTTREAGEVETVWRRAGLSKDDRLAFFCGTGWRASEAFFNAWLMGWARPAVYDGGWFEWSSDPGNPVETGPVG